MKLSDERVCAFVTAELPDSYRLISGDGRPLPLGPLTHALEPDWEAAGKFSSAHKEYNNTTDALARSRLQRSDLHGGEGGRGEASEFSCY